MSLPDVQSAVQAIQVWLDDPPGEAVVRQCIVLRLLLAAGFDIWNPEEVHPEETNVTGNRADFLVRRGTGQFALELKGMSATLQARDYQQALNYAVSVGTRWAIVTNGRLWRVLDERLDGDWNAKIALTIEMSRDDQNFGEDIAALLDPPSWERDAFADVVQTVSNRQQQRKDEARIRREKTRVVEETQSEFEIASFEKAADAAAKMGRITEAERDVLLKRVTSASLKPEEIEFTYSIGAAKATAIYRPDDGT
ncbi:type I restriction enzyme HsdR N-terminal domain-containing protein [Deinococcus sp.]|uniref:type I restriction enzyme HsdR N-terminal domain-containing protein n=1 Tax=Deinococcus sp. TaxID=47478 RepID=UPI0025C41F6B|nr:type I restriction enzyme HsdR N-terminal domain-containing protein [Deinococcus sp.]